MSKSLLQNQGNLRFAWQYESNGDSKFAKANGPSKCRLKDVWDTK
jgi:hypothetical protein